MPRQFARPMAYDPSLGANTIQQTRYEEESKKKAAMDLGFDEDELRDQGVESDSFEEEDMLQQRRQPPPPPPEDHYNGQLSPTPSFGASEASYGGVTSPTSSSRRTSQDIYSDTKLQTQLDALKRVNAQLTKEKDHLSKQLQHVKSNRATPPPPTSSGKTSDTSQKALQLIADAEEYIATLRHSSNNYVETIRKERQLYQQGAPTVVQQLQKDLAAAKASRANGKAADPLDSVSSQDSGFWKEQCDKLNARLQEKDRTLEELQNDLDKADDEANQADKDMAIMAEKMRLMEGDVERMRERMESMEDVTAGKSSNEEAMKTELEKSDQRCTELSQQLEAQKATISKMNDLLQAKEAQAASNNTRAAAMSASKKELHHQLKKMKKTHMAMSAAAADFHELVSPEGWSKLMTLAVDKARGLQLQIEQQAAAKCQQESQMQLAALRAELAEVQQKWQKEHQLRKQLHNEVVELKGNIRVLCRVRPFNAKEDSEGAQPAIDMVDDDTVRIMTEKGSEKEFEFNRCFQEDTPQDVVYSEVSSLVTSVVDGYNVCIMAYGQTGSGKTYTMEGPASDPGVNTRALRELFAVAAARCQDYEVSISTSVLEIYNEDVKDLLSGSKTALAIRAQSDGVSPVDGLTIVEVADMEQVQRTLERGQANRSTFATNMNEHSSRSHLVLSVYTTTRNRETGAVFTGKLHLVDLAGSERLSKTGATGDRLKEAQNINKSLSALGDVIAALQQRAKHIPYRNSKLTHLLQDSLGGRSKVLMFVNCSPASTNAGETLCSLNFAARASKVELGKATQSGSGSGTPTSAKAMSRNSSVSGLSKS